MLFWIYKILSFCIAAEFLVAPEAEFEAGLSEPLELALVEFSSTEFTPSLAEVEFSSSKNVGIHPRSSPAAPVFGT